MPQEKGPKNVFFQNGGETMVIFLPYGTIRKKHDNKQQQIQDFWFQLLLHTGLPTPNF